MRGSFIKKLTELAAQDERIFLLTGDLGYMALEPFAEKYPNRYVNVGVAEQNMVGIATGLAEAGYIPFCYSIVTFAALRPYEFIRNGPILHNLPVRIVGVGGGIEYSHNGASHWGLEDIGVMRVQPGITVVAPADYKQTMTALEKTWNMPGPVYYRLGKNDREEVAGLKGAFELGKIQSIRDGKDILIVTMGSVAPEAVAAADMLSHENISCAIAVVASINPAPTDDLANLLSRYNQVISVEAHYRSGGLASLLSEMIAQRGINSKLIPCAIENTPDGITGSLPNLYDKLGLSRNAITYKVMNLSAGVTP